MDCALLVRLGDRNRSVPLSLNELHRCLALSVVMHGWGALVTLLGSNSTVANSHIESANWITRQHTANITVSGANQKILNNTLRSCTGKMIAFILYDGVPVTGITIRGNDCRKYAYAMFDGGTACFYTNGKDNLGGAEISYNLIAQNMTLNDRVSCGIYLDDGAHNATIHHNVIHFQGVDWKAGATVKPDGP